MSEGAAMNAVATTRRLRAALRAAGTLLAGSWLGCSALVGTAGTAWPDEAPMAAPPAAEPPAAEAPAEAAADPAEGADLAAAERALTQADALRDEGRWNEAAESYWAARKANPADFRTHRLYQEMCRRAGDDPAKLVTDYDGLAAAYSGHVAFRVHRLRLDPAAARLEALEALRVQHPQDGDLALDLARTALEAGEIGKAQKVLKDLAGALSGPRAVDAVLLAADADLRGGGTVEARKRVDAALAAQPDNRELLLLAARLDLLDNLHDAGLERITKVLAGRPNHLAATLVQSELLSRLGKRDEAIAALERAVRTAKDRPEALLPLADLVASQETEVAYARAMELYTKVLEGKPNHPRACYGQAWILERQVKWKEAEELYRKALLDDASWARAVHSVGYCQLRQGRVSEAQVQIKKALDLDPQLISAMLDLAATYDAQANYAQALKQYEKVLKVKGQEQNLRALVNCAFDHEALGAFAKSHDMLLRAHKVAPDDVDIVVWLGDNDYFQERWKDAEKWYQKAVGMDEKSFFGWRGLGFTLGHQKRWADAAAALEKSKALRPTDKDVLLALGDIYMLELEDLEKALTAYEEYVQAGGDDPAVPEIITEIKKALGR